MSDAQARAAVLALNVREAGEQFADAVEELRPLAEELAAAEAGTVAAHQAGVHDDRPPARELAAEITPRPAHSVAAVHPVCDPGRGGSRRRVSHVAPALPATGAGGCPCTQRRPGGAGPCMTDANRANAANSARSTNGRRRSANAARPRAGWSRDRGTGVRGPSPRGQAGGAGFAERSAASRAGYAATSANSPPAPSRAAWGRSPYLPPVAPGDAENAEDALWRLCRADGAGHRPAGDRDPRGE